MCTAGTVAVSSRIAGLMASLAEAAKGPQEVTLLASKGVPQEEPPAEGPSLAIRE